MCIHGMLGMRVAALACEIKARTEASTVTDPARVGKTDPAQAEIRRDTSPALTPERLPATDLQPDQAPVRDTPDVGQRQTSPTR